MVERNAAIRCGLLLVATYAVRALFLKFAVRMDLSPLVFITPRGLISILLYFSLPTSLQLPQVGTTLLFLLVLSTCLVMALGLIAAGKTLPLIDTATEER